MLYRGMEHNSEVLSFEGEDGDGAVIRFVRAPRGRIASQGSARGEVIKFGEDGYDADASWRS